jgi:putative endonuclease
MQNRKYYVYIITNKINTVLYTGITNNIERRVYEHKNKIIEGFSSKYKLNKLVYCEETNDVMSALEREKQIKSGSRKNKIDLIIGTNPNWKDLS